MAKEASLKIGNDIQPGTLREVSEAIERIFKSGFENRMEQETIKSALSALSSISKVENINVSNSVFKGDRTIHLNDDNDETE